eukprot:536690_1
MHKKKTRSEAMQRCMNQIYTRYAYGSNYLDPKITQSNHQNHGFPHPPEATLSLKFLWFGTFHCGGDVMEMALHFHVIQEDGTVGCILEVDDNKTNYLEGMVDFDAMTMRKSVWILNTRAKQRKHSICFYIYQSTETYIGN